MPGHLSHQVRVSVAGRDDRGQSVIKGGSNGLRYLETSFSREQAIV